MSDEMVVLGCPFCGKKPVVKAVRFGMEKDLRYGVVCQPCGICLGWSEKEQNAIKRWNTRSNDTEKEA